MFTITKQFHFSASHVLEGLSAGHPCGRLHGHNYIVELELRAPVLDDVGFVTDYGDLAPVGRWLDEVWDHRHLNDVFSELNLLGNPTAETLAALVFDSWSAALPHLTAVRVSETPKTWAEFRR